MAQYDVAHAAGEAGLKYDTNPSQSESYVAEGNLPLGVAVVQGTSADQAAPPSATDTLIINRFYCRKEFTKIRLPS